MTGPPSSSYPSQVSPSAVEISPENRREKLGFARNFAGFVLRRPAAIFGDQVRVRPDFGMRFRPLPVSFWGTSKNKSDSKLGVLPRVGVWAHDLEVFRRWVSLWTPTRCRRVWRRVGTVAEGHYCPNVILRVPNGYRISRVFQVLPRSCRIRRIVKRSPGYSGNANPGVRVLVTVRSCDRERSDRPIKTKLAGRAS
ncbi:unnamed protein product [Prunus armeniaca]